MSKSRLACFATLPVLAAALTMACAESPTGTALDRPGSRPDGTRPLSGSRNFASQDCELRSDGWDLETAQNLLILDEDDCARFHVDPVALDGMDAARFCGRGTTGIAYMDADTNEIAIWFAGSDDEFDWAADAIALQQPFPLDNHKLVPLLVPSVHAGFLCSYQSIEDQLEVFLRARIQEIFPLNGGPTPRIYFTGHSLGGALSIIAALDLSGLLTDAGYEAENIVVRTFGAPRTWGTQIPQVAKLTYRERVPNSYEIAARQDPAPHLLGLRFTHTDSMKVLTSDWFDGDLGISGGEDQQETDVANLEEVHKTVRIENQWGPAYADCESLLFRRPSQLNVVIYGSQHKLPLYEARMGVVDGRRPLTPGTINAIRLGTYRGGLFGLVRFMKMFWDTDGDANQITGKCDRIDLFDRNLGVVVTSPRAPLKGRRTVFPAFDKPFVEFGLRSRETLFPLFLSSYKIIYRDGAGNILSNDNRPPVANAGPDQTVECTGQSGTVVQLNGSGSSDPNGDALTFTWTGPFAEGEVTGPEPVVTLPVGTHTIQLAVNDGQATGTDEVTITVEDTAPPEVSFALLTDEPWPAHHKMVLVASGVSAFDLCDPSPVLRISVTSNEPVNGPGDGNTEPDWDVIDNGDGTFDVQLRAERSGRGRGGRIYTITATATDASGNTSLPVTAEVTVSHDRGKKN